MYRGRLHDDLCCFHLLPYLEGSKVCAERATVAQKLSSARQFALSRARSKVIARIVRQRRISIFDRVDMGTIRVHFYHLPGAFRINHSATLAYDAARARDYASRYSERACVFRVRNNQRRANFRPAAYAGRLNAEALRTESRPKRDSRIPRELTEFSPARAGSLIRSRVTRLGKTRARVQVKIVRSEIITRWKWNTQSST